VYLPKGLALQEPVVRVAAELPAILQEYWPTHDPDIEDRLTASFVRLGAGFLWLIQDDQLAPDNKPCADRSA
jgi:hypothetical protein